MQRLRVGVIGLGDVAEIHLEAYRDLDGIEVVAGTETRGERLEEITRTWGIRGYGDHEAMLDTEELDIACVLTPAGSHAKVTQDVAKHGVHVLCEKPLATTLDDATAMIETCRDEGVKLFYGSSYRFLPAVMKAKELINQGRLGNVTLLLEVLVGGRGRRHFQDLGPDHYPPGGPGGGGMGMVDHGIHLMDIFPWLMGSEVESVVGRVNTSGSAPEPEFLTMSFENGAVGQLVFNEATFASDMPQEGIFAWGSSWGVHGDLIPGGGWNEHPENIRIHGEEGALRIFYYANKLFYFAEDTREQVRVPDRPMPLNFADQMQSFARGILRGEEPEVTGEDGSKALRVLLAAYESWESRRIVSP
jgi:predicted dehydrogenase